MSKKPKNYFTLKAAKKRLRERIARRNDPGTQMRQLPHETDALREARAIVRILGATTPFDTGAAQWIERQKIAVRHEELVKLGADFGDAYEVSRAEWLLDAQGVKFKPWVPTAKPRAKKRAERVRHEAERGQRAPVKSKPKKATKQKPRRVQIESDE